MEDIKQYLIDSKRDYREGARIFSKYSTNKYLADFFIRGSVSLQSKLEYELKKILGIPLPILFNQKCSNEQLLSTFFKKDIPKPEESKVVEKKPEQILNKIKTEQTPCPANVNPEYYQIIQQCKDQLFNLSTKIATIHNELFEVGKGNSETLCNKRKKLLDKRKPLIKLYDRLYELKEEYFRTEKMPEELKKLIEKTGTSEETVEKNTSKEKISNLTDIQLLRKKTALASSITKLQNKITYQSISKLPQPRPLPTGTVRTAAEKKLKMLKNDYKQVMKSIEERSKR